ncbi:MAG: hypothetical protein V3S49_04705, partial [Thermodesulfobacteriota bacterium]
MKENELSERTEKGVKELNLEWPRADSIHEIRIHRVISYDEDDQKMSVLGLPLGPFFCDTGNKVLDDMGPLIAKKSIMQLINSFRNIDSEGVLFCAFISEVWMRIIEPGKKEFKKE